MNAPAKPIAIERQIACARDEANKRRHFYPRWVSAGKMSAEEAADRIACMEAIEQTLVRLRDEERTKVAPPLF